MGKCDKIKKSRAGLRAHTAGTRGHREGRAAPPPAQGRTIDMRKYLTAWAAALLCLLLLSGCAEQQQDIPVDPAPQPPVELPQEEPEPAPPALTSPLTGLEMDESLAGKRPYAVMINNVKQALPQMGVSKAELVVEFPTEGSTDRMMAFFYDVADIPAIGTVRSSRDYFLDYAQAVDAIYLHYGGSPQAYAAIKARGIDNLDGINGRVDSLLYWRDKERARKNGSEHSVFTSGEKILHTVAELKVRTDSKKKGDFFAFGTADMASGEAAEKVTLPFSNYITPVFAYDAGSGRYLREEYGAAHVDAAYGNTQLSVKNLFVLFTRVSAISGDSAGRLSIATSGEGDGLYITDGRVLPVTWQKADNDSFVQFRTVDGKPLTVNAGNSWIAVLGTSKKDKVTLS